MRKIALLFCLFFSVSFLNAQALQGTYERSGSFGDRSINYVYLFSGEFFSWTAFYEDGEFIATKGGSFDLSNDELMLTYEFDTADPNMVGRTEEHTVSLKKKTAVIDNQVWKNTDKGKESPLSGPWLMGGRKRDGEISRRDTDRPRKTMKILTPTRFQWIAYNTETKAFMGTGGGTYTAVDGKYTENIEFFSRDKTRVGASLGFNFEVKGDDWHHSGKSSKGDPMYEIWVKRMP
ncbi:MAG TPA: hypothetical protein VJ953_21000 [Saprospiraceae bacterium]|nr:hypothetical protein [Saprospiraceae bacterium]